MKVIIIQNLIIDWIYWHFFGATKNLLRIWGNFLKFSLNFFSVSLLIKTAFQPWKRISQSYMGLADFFENFQIFVLNSFSRLFGFLMRLIFLMVGLSVTFLIFILGFLLILIWILLPAIIFFGLILSIMLII